MRVRADIVFTRRKVAVFVDGCYWHGCPEHGSLPKSNRDYWFAKITANKARDQRAGEALERAGWHVVRIWEHNDVDDAAARIAALIGPQGETAR